MKELENLELTDKDFKLLVEGLDALPSKDLGGEIMFALLGSMALKDDPEGKDKFKREMLSDRASKEREKALLIEEIRILQGKLLQLQRYLRMNNLLKQANDLL